MNILLIEDERTLALAIIRILGQENHRVDWQTNGADGLYAALAGDYDLIVLDLLLPKKSGWDVCRDLRVADRNVPVLMLSAMDESGDKIRGLDLGADDFLAKPFDPGELVARVRALSRRDVVHPGRKIRIDDLEIDRGRQRVARASVEVELTRLEYEILVNLAVREGQVVKPATLAPDGGPAADPLGTPVDAHVESLRAKIDGSSRLPLIHSIDGGYSLGRTLGVC